jgi:heme/copper-type cytochrome/quinol oxidase subunit 2
MRKLITASIALALITTTAQAGWFGPSDQEINLQNQLSQQHTNTLIIAGILILCVIVAFIVGTILGSRTRRNAKQPDSSEPQ